MAKLIFHGAAGEVTGSMHLLETDGACVALDCGLFQGRREESRRKNLTFPRPPERITAVVLSHAHIDHCGRLPRLVRDGFDGPIYCTPATLDLATVMLADSAHIQAEDVKFLNKKKARRGEALVEPLYSIEDAIQTMRRLHAVPFGRPFQVTPRVTARFHEAGHMLGSAGVELKLNEGGRTLVFSGDIGRPGVPILRDPQPLPDCDYLICESTYGGRRSDPVKDMKPRLEKVVNDTIARGGKVIIPAFSVGRTQTIVYNLHELFSEGRIKRLPIYVDSPLAVNATEVFRMHPECYDRDARELDRQTNGMLGASIITYVRDVEDSKAINRKRSPCVIISASGMCETGRILHHLRNNIRSEKNTVLIVGFQAAHTLGRRLVEGARTVKIFGETLPARAAVVVLNGYSSHADAEELRAYVAPQASRCRRAFLVHGEPDQAEALRRSMGEMGYAGVWTPSPGEEFELE